MKWCAEIVIFGILASFTRGSLVENRSIYGDNSDNDVGLPNGTRWSNIAAEPTIKYITAGIGIIGAIGNCFVLVVMTSSKHLRQQTTNKFIMHQCFIDTFGGLILIFNTIFDDINAVPPGLSSDIFCSLWISEYFQWALMRISTSNLVIMTLEKYLSLFHFKLHGMLFTKKQTLFAFLASWVYGLVCQSFTIVSTQMKGNQCSVHTEFNFDPTVLVIVIVLVVHVLLPIMIFSICYGRIVYHFFYILNKPDVELFHSPTSIKSMKNIISLDVGVAYSGGQHRAPVTVSGDFERMGSMMYTTKKNSMLTLVVVAIGYLICWTPNCIYFTVFIATSGAFTSMTSIPYHVTAGMAFCNTLINPIIYAIVYKDFQKCVKKMFSPSVKRYEPIVPIL